MEIKTKNALKKCRYIFTQRLTIINNQCNRGVSHVRNCGINQAQGNWIALLDSDDWYAPERIEKLSWVAQKSNADLVADNLFLIHDGKKHPWSTLLQENEQEIPSVKLIDTVEFVAGDRQFSINSKRNWSFGYTKPLIKREFLLKHQLKYNVYFAEKLINVLKNIFISTKSQKLIAKSYGPEFNK